DFQRTLAVNVGGVFSCYRSAARQMIDQGRGGGGHAGAARAAHPRGRGHGGGAGARPPGGKGQAAYSASKFAVRGLRQSVAQELAEHGITVNVYSPGVVHTPMWESIDEAMTGRLGTAPGSELAGMVAGIPLGRLETP